MFSDLFGQFPIVLRLITYFVTIIIHNKVITSIGNVTKGMSFFWRMSGLRTSNYCRLHRNM
jgi:hypothetical protein